MDKHLNIIDNRTIIKAIQFRDGSYAAPKRQFMADTLAFCAVGLLIGFTVFAIVAFGGY